MAVAPSGLTLDEFLKLPEEKPALEYINGVIRQKVSPKARHGVLQLAIAERVNATARMAEIAMALPEARVTFAGSSRVPDVAVYRWAHIPVDAEGEIVDDLREPPDIAVEIVSPGQSARTVTETCRWYVSHGVEIALLVDPARRSVTEFRAEGGTNERRGSDRIDISTVIPDFELTVDQLFESLRVRHERS